MRTIGKFQVVEKIGEGGFGVIYKGLDPHIKRHVAIKSCTSKDEHVRTRFAQEAQISGNLHHRHIVTVYDFGHQDGVPYLVQEYLNGEDLDRKIKRRDFIAFPEKLLYLMQIARGLQYAHSQGVIHRDIKPANLRILEDGTAKIMDFGIAKLTNQDTGLTQTGMTLGTAAYLAPEQIRGESVDLRTDIFAFGATAYELLTYRRPFVGQHISTVLYQILNEEPPSIASVLPEVPEELDQLVMRCLEKDLTKRYSDVGELLRDLDRLLKKRRTEITTKTLQPAEAESDSTTRANRLEEERQAAERTVVSSTTPTQDGSTRPPERKERTDTALHDVELDGTGESRLTPHGIDASRILRRRQFQWAPWAAGVVALAALVLAGWTYYLRSSTAIDINADSDLEIPVANAEGVTDNERKTTTGPGGQQEGAGSNNGNPEDGLEGTGAKAEAEGENGDASDAGESAEATDPPPPSQPAQLHIPAAWSPSMSVAVGSKTYSLDRARDLELPPGTYTLNYRLQLEGYSDSATQTVNLTADEAASVRVPIQQPGLLDVQPRLSSPQKGYVYLGRELLGPSPVRGRQVKPGTYTLRVVPDLGDDQVSIETPVTLSPGGKLIVTFDLGSGDMILRDAGD